MKNTQKNDDGELRTEQLRSGCSLSKELKILKVICSDCRTLNLIPYAFIGDEPVKCEKCGKVLVIRE